ncbi:hypothetical protein [uncultured Ruminococcus sp.]|uniref:hypothetical protein n=1 Tax=uncultured Ruminococcus sp. TaxID=165186 RepID=UPI000EDCD783|nr:hypothetical protein [uncultured Ruminococcus sp.]HCJ41643.1 hypothetical protein [Ruminococcus sp.]
MSFIKRISALACTATIALSAFAAMPVSAAYHFNDGRTVGYYELKDDAKKKMYSVWKPIVAKGRVYETVHCGDLYTFTSTFKFLFYTSRSVTLINEPKHKEIGNTRMKTLSARVECDGKFEDTYDVSADNYDLAFHPCVTNPLDLPKKDVKIRGYYDYY